MHKSLIIETSYKVSIVFRKEIFINAKKVLNFIQSLTNERKVIKSLTASHICVFFCVMFLNIMRKTDVLKTCGENKFLRKKV